MVTLELVPQVGCFGVKQMNAWFLLDAHSPSNVYFRGRFKVRCSELLTGEIIVLSVVS